MRKEKIKQLLKFSPITLTAVALSSCVPNVETTAVLQSNKNEKDKKQDESKEDSPYLNYLHFFSKHKFLEE